MSIDPENSLLLLRPKDTVAIARSPVAKGTCCQLPTGEELRLEEPIDMGHKVAVRSMKSGDPIIKFGQVIGFASSHISPGYWVHVHNVSIGSLTLEYEFSTAVPPDPEPITERTFLGYHRPNGKVGTRNYLGIISTVNCSATASKLVANAFDESILEEYPNIDGVVALTHKIGCAIEYGGESHQQLARTLAGFAKHPNIGAYLILGLGCETSQASFLVNEHRLVQLEIPGQEPEPLPIMMNIQDMGGVRKTVERSIEVLHAMLPEVNNIQREPLPVSELILGTECGGSDGSSGITANPALGVASNMLVAHGGTTILSEVPEIYGAEHILTRRAVSREVGEKLLERIRWWEEYAAKFGAEIDNNPSVGNKKGGLTTIYEKSLGAIAKAGSTSLQEVYQYAEPITKKGFVIMDSPGYDPPSVTGMIASGANIVVFTTGRGSCFGCKPVPTIKVATNTPLYSRMPEDMDINAGRILEGTSVKDVGEEIFEKIISVASGEKTKSEAQGIGDEEFCPWNIGPIL